MILQNKHNIDILVNGQRLEFKDENIGLIFSNQLTDILDIETKNAEYSFEISIPVTKNNNIILGYANNLSQLNKFNRLYNAEVYADGVLIFNGVLTITSTEKSSYTANLVSIKTYSLEDIFGEHTLYDLNWYITYHGAPTINETNQTNNHQYYFPFVSYGVFQKDPYYTDEVASDYTSKYLIDEWNRWYYSSFEPSLNMLETIRKAFQQYGYNVGGNAFQDPILSNVYMSMNITNDQIPQYNYGHPRFGSCNIKISGTTSGRAINQELDYKTVLVGNMYPDNAKVKGADYETYDWSYIDIYDCLDSSSTVTHYTNSYLFDDNESVIVAPADGFYEIHMEATATLNPTTLTAYHYYTDKFVSASTSALTTEQAETRWNAPIEFQVVKNYDATNSNLELIHGSKHQIRWTYDNQDVQTEIVNTDYPHQALGDSLLVFRPTKAVDNTSNSGVLGGRNENTSGTSRGTSEGNNGSYRGGSRSSQGRTSAVSTKDKKIESATDMGYIHKDTHCFDAMINSDFICGISSIGDGTASVIKNGYSTWREYTPKIENFYKCSGYLHRQKTSDGTYSEATSVNENMYANSPRNSATTTSSSVSGAVTCCVYLNRNDILSIKAIQRYYDKGQGVSADYSYNYTINFKLKAISPKDYEYLKSLPIEYGMDSQFDIQLRLGNFLSSGTTIVSFIENVKKAFNLEIIQEGKNVYINTQNYKLGDSKNKYAIELDNRVNSANGAKSSAIDFPKSFSVEYNIDTEEKGFMDSIPREFINSENYKDYGDSGFTKVQMNELSDKEEKISLPFSYTYYCDFTKGDNSYNIPCISKEIYMVDGYSYEDSMKEDGMSQPLRFWFRQDRTTDYVELASLPYEIVYLDCPINKYKGVNLSYKTDEKSLLTEYFNIIRNSESNYIEVDAYITAEEYALLKNYALVHFDTDLYIPTNLQYNPADGKCTIKMVKK